MTGVKEGKQSEFYESGNRKLESEFRGGKENGRWILFYDDKGVKKNEENYVIGKKQ